MLFWFFSWGSVLGFCLWGFGGRTFGSASSLLLRNMGKTGGHLLANVVEQPMQDLIQTNKTWHWWHTRPLVKLVLIGAFPQLWQKFGEDKWTYSEPLSHKMWLPCPSDTAEVCSEVICACSVVWILDFVLNQMVHFYLYGVHELTQVGSPWENMLKM